MQKLSLIPFNEFTRIPLFIGIDQQDWVLLLEAAHEKHFRAGEYFFQQGAQMESVYILMLGIVRRTRVRQDGGQELIKLSSPIQTLGFEALTMASTYPESAQAVVACQAVAWDAYDLMMHVMKIPQLALNAMRIMADQLEELRRRHPEQTTQRVEQRLAFSLIQLAGHSGKRVKEGILIERDITRQDLAQLSDVTIYAASRTLSRWQALQLIIAGRETIIVRNPHMLARIVQETII